jgi:hypothetical protein
MLYIYSELEQIEQVAYCRTVRRNVQVSRCRGGVGEVIPELALQSSCCHIW